MVRSAGSLLKRSSVVALVLVIVSACSGSTTSSTVGSGTGPSGPPTSATAASSPDDSGPKSVTDTLTGGWYGFGPFGDASAPISIVAKGPDGWTGYPDWAMDGPEPLRADAPDGIGIAFFTANGLYGDPCHWDVRGIHDAGLPGDVKVGTTVDDMVAALRANTFYTSTAPKPVSIDGYTGTELELQLPDDPYTKCDKDDPSDPGGHEFVFSGPGLYAQGRGNRWHLYILNVHGTPLIAVILSYTKTPQADLNVARNVVETLRIKA
jgi:hypothetical protein